MLKLKFSDILSKKIFKNRDDLFSIIPETGTVERIEEKNCLVLELSPLLLNSSIRGIFVQGNPGTGKTACTLELLNELQKEIQSKNTNLKKIYVNCSENRTESTILLEILRELDPEKVYPKQGWSRSKIIEEFYSYIKKHNTENIIIILDEVDFVLKKEGDDILYRLSRTNSYLNSNINVIYISNDENISKYLKKKTISSLGRLKIVFPPYCAKELESILVERSKSVFYKCIVEKSALKYISEMEEIRGDARSALNVLDQCGKILLTSKENKLNLNIVKEAYKALDLENRELSLDLMSLHEKMLYLSILKNAKNIFSLDDILSYYAEVCSFYDINKKTKRSLLPMIKNLNKLGLIKINSNFKEISIEIDKGFRKKMIKKVRDSI